MNENHLDFVEMRERAFNFTDNDDIWEKLAKSDLAIPCINILSVSKFFINKFKKIG